MARRPSDRQPLADQMYDVLLGQFMDGLWSPGQSLNIGALTRELNVSQTPCAKLSPGSNTPVWYAARRSRATGSPPLQRDRADQTDGRAAGAGTDPHVRGGPPYHPEFLQDVAASIEELRHCAEGDGSKSVRAYLSADERFHFLIARQSANPFLESAYRSLGGHVQRFRLFTELGSSDAESPAHDHTAVYDALAAGDAEGAADRMRQHIENAKARALKDRQAVTVD